MRILLDECFPRKLKRELPGHEVLMVQEMGWSGRKNGALLSVAAPSFDVLITVDRNLPHQQNLERFEIGIVVLKAVSNRIEYLSPLMPEVRRALGSIQPRQFVLIGA
jgi:hypothetical protein